MDAFADTLGRVGAAFGQNKYLNSIKNAFQNFMPATIAGAVGVLWTNVLVNADTGLGKLWEPIMALQVLNPIFAAIQYATISCITIGVTMLLAQEIAEANGETGSYPAVLGFILWTIVTPTTFKAGDLGASVTSVGGNSVGVTLKELFNPAAVQKALDAAAKSLPAGDKLPAGAANGITIDSFSYTGILSSYTGATGLFTGLIIAIIGLEIYNLFRKTEALKIKMPEQVPPGVAKAFEVLIPTVLTGIVIGAISLVCQLVTKAELNALIYNSVQAPLQNIIGNNIVAVCIMYVIIMLFWCVGIHGNNMLAAVKEPIFRPLLYANVAAFTTYHSREKAPNIMNLTMLQMFAEFGGSGVTIGLVIAILIFSKREDNRTIAGISVVPGLFNINETMTFGIPLVLNPILDIPFILAPVVTMIVGYILVLTRFCPKIVVEVPWTMPPVFFGFIATGGHFMGAVAQLIVLAVSVVVYVPFLFAYEAYQNKQAAAE